MFEQRKGWKIEIVTPSRFLFLHFYFWKQRCFLNELTLSHHELHLDKSVMFVLCLSSAGHRAYSRVYLKKGKEESRKQGQGREGWLQIKGVGLFKDKSKSLHILCSLLNKRGPKWAIFRTTLWILGCIFSTNGLVWLNNCGSCTYANRNKYEQELFIVITIQSDTSASGWKFLQLHSSFFIVSKIIISATEQAWGEWIETLVEHHMISKWPSLYEQRTGNSHVETSFNWKKHCSGTKQPCYWGLGLLLTIWVNFHKCIILSPDFLICKLTRIIFFTKYCWVENKYCMKCS